MYEFVQFRNFLIFFLFLNSYTSVIFWKYEKFAPYRVLFDPTPNLFEIVFWDLMWRVKQNCKHIKIRKHVKKNRPTLL